MHTHTRSAKNGKSTFLLPVGNTQVTYMDLSTTMTTLGELMVIINTNNCGQFMEFGFEAPGIIIVYSYPLVMFNI